jgi:hypothetical protein
MEGIAESWMLPNYPRERVRKQDFQLYVIIRNFAPICVEDNDGVIESE